MKLNIFKKIYKMLSKKQKINFIIIIFIMIISALLTQLLPISIGNLTDNILIIPKVHPLLSPILSIIPLQLLAYYVSKEKGLDVDKPRNLAKSVTVE